MDEEIQKPEPKISDVEIVLIGLFYLGLDAIDLIPIAGELTDIIAAPMGFYYWMKGLNATTFIVAEVLDLVPGIQAIPSRTIGWGITVYLDRNQKLAATLAPALALAGALEGDIEGAEENAARGTGTPNAARTAEGETADGGSSGEQNARPSEKTTERDAQEQTNQRRRQGNVEEAEGGDIGTGGGSESKETDEERRKREAAEEDKNDEKDDELEKEMRLGEEVPWEETAQEKYFRYQEAAPQKKAPKVESIDAGRARVQANTAKEKAEQGEQPQKTQEQSHTVEVDNKDDIKKAA